MIGTQEIILILIAAFLIFGARKIPDIARSIGTGFREFKKALSPDADKGDEVHSAKEKNIKRYNAKVKPGKSGKNR
jgi:sec-independent protein translocase protein TatA